MKATYRKPDYKTFYELGLEEHSKKDIALYFDAKEHMKNRHMHEFKCPENYYNAVDYIQDILLYPNFTYYDEKKKGMLFYAKIDENVCLVVEITTGKELKIDTMYPVMEKKVEKMKRLSFIQKVDIEQRRLIEKYTYKERC